MHERACARMCAQACAWLGALCMCAGGGCVAALRADCVSRSLHPAALVVSALSPAAWIGLTGSHRLSVSPADKSRQQGWLWRELAPLLQAAEPVAGKGQSGHAPGALGWGMCIAWRSTSQREKWESQPCSSCCQTVHLLPSIRLCCNC